MNPLASGVAAIDASASLPVRRESIRRGQGLRVLKLTESTDSIKPGFHSFSGFPNLFPQCIIGSMKSAGILPILRHRADWRTLAFITLALFISVGNWTGIFRNSLTVTLSYPLAFICCIATHNQMHLPLFLRRFWNSALQVTLAMAIGQPPTGIITAHNERHHKHPDSNLDFVRTGASASNGTL